MENEIQEIVLNAQEILVQQGNVSFPDYDRLKQEALDLAERIEALEVSDENIKSSKKLLAAVNKRLKELEDRRIKIKKLMLQPYALFETQVKEIVGIVRDADDVVRQQVKALEEMERAEKQGAIHEIFEKRISHYSFRDLFHFTEFLKPKHLNKSTTMQSVEDDMISFFERIASDMNAIQKMPNAAAILSAYMETKDLAAAMIAVDQAEQRRKQIEGSAAIKKADKAKISHLISICCHSQKELRFVEMLLEENEIEYEVDKIN